MPLMILTADASDIFAIFKRVIAEQGDLQVLTQRVRELEASRDALQQTVAELQRSHTDLDQELSTTRVQLAAMRKENRSLKSRLREFESQA